MNKFLKIFLSVLLCSALLFSACGEKPTSAPETEISKTESETASEPSVTESTEFKLVIPESYETHICTDDLYECLQKAVDYKLNDYSYTFKDNYDLGSTTDGAKVFWGYENPQDVKEVWATIYLDGSTDNTVRIKGKKPTARSTEGAVFVPNLYTNHTYSYFVEATMKDGSVVKSDTGYFTTVGPRIMTVSGIKNMRDLGGYLTASGKRIRQGMIFRSYRPNDLTPAGCIYMIENLGMKGELDLRNPETEGDCPVESPIQDQLNYFNQPGSSYVAFWTDYDRARSEFEFLLNEDNYPLFFHCRVGADRTGALGFLILSLLGVDENTAVSDYEITPGRYRIGNKTDEGGYYNFPGFIQVFKEFPGETNSEKARYFLAEKCGIANEKIDWFINFMLED